jgi:hypothetical protein
MIFPSPLTISLSAVLALAPFSVAEPIIDKDKCATRNENFYLFGSPLKSTAAANATALDLVDPLYQQNYLLRMEAGQSPYETFNLTGYALLHWSRLDADAHSAEVCCRRSTRRHIQIFSRSTTRTSTPHPARTSSCAATARPAFSRSRAASSRTRATRTTGRGASANSCSRLCVLLPSC